ncbi:MAG: flavin-containing monooxygenase, partial [Solirubrobacteraceae bacterium]
MRTTAEHLDVVIVGAGLSGVGAACHLQRHCPDRSWAILEARERIGGTWDLFRYPGVRSDSDMHTLGYSFEPWEDGQAIADGPAILDYVRRTAQRYGVLDRVRTGCAVVRAEWSSADERWTLQLGDGETLTCSFMMLCTGYYDYDAGHEPPLPGAERFAGPIVHPQHWPADLDYRDRRVVVIGSGATAVTLVPAMAPTTAHVTMLQRSPSYIISLPARDALAERLRARLPRRAAYRLVRLKNVALMTASYQLSRRRPALMRGLIRRGAARQLPDGFDVDTHFSPDYAPWDQRMCVVPDGDLFRAVSDGTASMVTGQVQTVTERGLRLTDGRDLEADVIVTATGLKLLAVGGISLVVDGEEIDLPRRLVYRGMMLDGVPNMTFTVGYTNASWTLKADLVARYSCRLLKHMRRRGYATCVPVGPADAEIDRRPLIDLASGYVHRSVHEFPSQGTRRPWRLHQNYALDALELRLGRLQDGVLRFGRSRRDGNVGAWPPTTSSPAHCSGQPTSTSSRSAASSHAT